MNDFSAIRFPGLGFSINPSELVFPNSSFAIRWYGVLIAVGILLAALYGLKRSEKFGFSPDDLVDILIFGVVGAIVCARLYYVAFSGRLDEYLANPVSILQVWNGGLAIYGGIIGGMGVGAIAAKIKKIKPMAVLDLAAVAFPMAQAIGRIGNLINREAFGSPTTLPWRMELYKSGEWISVHPCFLYEALWNLIGFVALHFISKKRKFDGQILLLYVAWYGLGRAFIEGLRTDSLFIPGTGIRVSQLLAAASCVIAVVLFVIFTFIVKPNPREMQREHYARKKAHKLLEMAAEHHTAEERAAHEEAEEVFTVEVVSDGEPAPSLEAEPPLDTASDVIPESLTEPETIVEAEPVADADPIADTEPEAPADNNL